jgi:hypothetical protein
MVNGALVFNAQLASHAPTLWQGVCIVKNRPLYEYSEEPFTFQ